jgi:hypothetical protein
MVCGAMVWGQSTNAILEKHPMLAMPPLSELLNRPSDATLARKLRREVAEAKQAALEVRCLSFDDVERVSECWLRLGGGVATTQVRNGQMQILPAHEYPEQALAWR